MARKDTITISIKEYECLREHLNSAYQIFDKLGDPKRARKKPSIDPPKKRVPFAKGVANYTKLITSGEKRKLPDHLRKSNS